MMEEAIKKTLAAYMLTVGSDLVSKVPTKRNYVITTYDDRAYLYPFGEAKRRGLLRATKLVDIGEHGIMWFFFSRIREAEEALNTLQKNGYTISR